MRKFLATIALAALPLSCIQPSFAMEVGDVVGVQFVCVEQSTVERQIDIFMDKGLEATQRQLRTDAQAAQCLIFPMEVPAPVEEVGKEYPPILWPDGDTVQLRAVRVHGQWTIAVETVGPTT